MFKFKKSIAVLTTAAILASSTSIVASAAASAMDCTVDLSAGTTGVTAKFYVDYTYNSGGMGASDVEYLCEYENDTDNSNFKMKASAGRNFYVAFTFPEGKSAADYDISVKNQDETPITLGNAGSITVNTSASTTESVTAQAGAIPAGSTAVTVTVAEKAADPSEDPGEDGPTPGSTELDEDAKVVWINGKDNKKTGDYNKTCSFAVAGGYTGGKWNVGVTLDDYGIAKAESDYKAAINDADALEGEAKSAAYNAAKTAYGEAVDAARTKFIKEAIESDKGKIKKDVANKAKTVASAKLKDGMITVTAGKALSSELDKANSTTEDGLGTVYVWVFETKKRAKDAKNDTDGSPKDNVWGAAAGKTGVVYGDFEGCEDVVAPICVPVQVALAYGAPVLNLDGSTNAGKIAKGSEPAKGTTLKLFINDKKTKGTFFDATNPAYWDIAIDKTDVAEVEMEEIVVGVNDNGSEVKRKAPVIQYDEAKKCPYIEVKVKGAEKAKAKLTLTNLKSGKKASFAITCGKEKDAQTITVPEDVKVYTTKDDGSKDTEITDKKVTKDQVIFIELPDNKEFGTTAGTYKVTGATAVSGQVGNYTVGEGNVTVEFVLPTVTVTLPDAVKTNDNTAKVEYKAKKTDGAFADAAALPAGGKVNFGDKLVITFDSSKTTCTSKAGSDDAASVTSGTEIEVTDDMTITFAAVE